MSCIHREINGIYTERAHRRYGLSAVSQLQHALQAAALAEARGESAHMIVAALLHDVGHMIHDLGEDPARDGVDDLHEEAGARWLDDRFGPQVVEPVRLHVPAKRYLCVVDPGYFGTLSADSVRSLALQGGAMDLAQAEAFHRLPYAAEAVRLRRIDDLAKDPRAETPPLRHYLRFVDEILGLD